MTINCYKQPQKMPGTSLGFSCKRSKHIPRRLSKVPSKFKYCAQQSDKSYNFYNLMTILLSSDHI